MTNFNEDPKKFTVGEIAKILGAREETVRNWISSGQLKGTKENGQWLVTLQKAPKGISISRKCTLHLSPGKVPRVSSN